MTKFVKALRIKGWSAKRVAERWGMLPRQLSRIAKEPKQIHLDALAGLPNVKNDEERENEQKTTNQ